MSRVLGGPPSNNNDRVNLPTLWPLASVSLLSPLVSPFNSRIWGLPFPKTQSTTNWGLGSWGLDSFHLPHDGQPPALARSLYLYPWLLPDNSLAVLALISGNPALAPGNYRHDVLGVSQRVLLLSSNSSLMRPLSAKKSLEGTFPLCANRVPFPGALHALHSSFSATPSCPVTPVSPAHTTPT